MWICIKINKYDHIRQDDEKRLVINISGPTHIEFSPVSDWHEKYGASPNP